MSWGAPAGRLGDYVALVAKGATEVVDDDPYVNISVGSPDAPLVCPCSAAGKLTAPTKTGDYELWYVVGDTADSVLARRPITVR